MAESPKVSKNTSLIKTKSKSTSGTKLRKTNANYSFTLNSNGNNIENLREEINYLRQTIVSCNKEYSKIKTEQVKIEEEIKRNTLCLDEILRTSPTLTRLMINSIILGEDVSNESVLEWFIDEQVEEEENAKAIIDTLKLIGDNGYGLYQLDKELATRVYTPIATSEE